MATDHFEDPDATQSPIPTDGVTAAEITRAVLQRILFRAEEVVGAHAGIDARVACQLLAG